MSWPDECSAYVNSASRVSSLSAFMKLKALAGAVITVKEACINLFCTSERASERAYAREKERERETFFLLFYYQSSLQLTECAQEFLQAGGRIAKLTRKGRGKANEKTERSWALLFTKKVIFGLRVTLKQISHFFFFFFWF